MRREAPTRCNYGGFVNGDAKDGEWDAPAHSYANQRKNNERDDSDRNKVDDIGRRFRECPLVHRECPRVRVPERRKLQVRTFSKTVSTDDSCTYFEVIARQQEHHRDGHVEESDRGKRQPRSQSPHLNRDDVARPECESGLSDYS